jgi:hypothetical protein
MSETQYGLPLIVTSFADATVRGLKRIRLEKGHDNDFDERWLQKLVSLHPGLLPIEEIEPALTPVIPLCMELPVASNFIDVLYATPDGHLIVAETKLFRNPEARRAVVAQIIDYAKDLSLLSYQQLEEAVANAQAPDGRGGHPKASIYQTVASGQEDVDERQFIDAVSRNLKRGRFLLLVIGDGIKEGTENIAAFLQQHVGMHFTLGLVVLAIFELPGEMGGYLVQPRVLARTQNIERGIVTIVEGSIVVKPPLDRTDGGAGPTTISEEKFYEELAAKFPKVVAHLKAFTERLEMIGVRKVLGKGTMNLKWGPDNQPYWNLGTISTSGAVFTDQINYQADRVGLLHLSRAYLERLASSMPGAYVKPTTGSVLNKNRTAVTIDELLAHEDDWLACIEAFMAAATDALKDQ